MDSIYCEANENQIYNHNFLYANKSCDFPEGWQIYRGSKSAKFSWEEKHGHSNRIRIINQLPMHPASIIQENFFAVPVYEKQVWEVGAVLKADHRLQAAIKIHFISRSYSRVIVRCIDFRLETKSDYCYGTLTVPAGFDYALVEIGTTEAGTVWIKDVCFKRVFPIGKYDTDARGRLNINTVESLKRIIEPVKVEGKFDLVRQTRDFVEDLTANPTEKTSTMQDVFYLATYSFCVINQGSVAALVRLQLSPNGMDWVEDPIADDHLDGGKMAILVYNRFARYVRLKYRTEDGSTLLKIYFQGQG